MHVSMWRRQMLFRHEPSVQRRMARPRRVGNRSRDIGCRYCKENRRKSIFSWGLNCHKQIAVKTSIKVFDGKNIRLINIKSREKTRREPRWSSIDRNKPKKHQQFNNLGSDFLCSPAFPVCAFQTLLFRIFALLYIRPAKRELQIERKMYASRNASGKKAISVEKFLEFSVSKKMWRDFRKLMYDDKLVGAGSWRKIAQRKMFRDKNRFSVQ